MVQLGGGTLLNSRGEGKLLMGGRISGGELGKILGGVGVVYPLDSPRGRARGELTATTYQIRPCLFIRVDHYYGSSVRR